MKKTIAKTIMIIAILAFTYANLGQVQAVTNQEITQQQLENYVKDIDPNNVSKEDILKIYDEVSKDYSPENIADMLEENAKEIEAQGVSKDVISAGAEFIRQTDTQSIRKIIEDDIDIEDIKEKIQKGYTADQILNSMVQETPTTKKVEIATKVLLSNKIIKTIVTIAVIVFIYGTILRWIIYTKAGKHGWAAIVPLYRQIVMYQVCGLSPFLMLLWLVPIFGWIAMLVIAIMKRFCLAKEFGRGAGFGFGLLFFGLIFQSILAFHPKIQKNEKEA